MKPVKLKAWNKDFGLIDVDEIYILKELIRIKNGDLYSFNEIKLLQDTGLHDINKKPIYENFLLKNNHGQKFCIKYDKYYAWYCLHEVEDGTIMNNIWTVNQCIIQNCEIEIIGNIYQNPELVKESE